MKKTLIIVLFIAIEEAICTEPTIAQRCNEHEYRHDDGSCKPCKMCPSGHQPVGYCGYGDRTVNYGCKVCPDGSYSLRNDYNICINCRPCEDWNSYTFEECSPTHDRVCGSCFEGFFRPSKSDGQLDEQCHVCAVAPSDTPECREEVKEPSWKVIAIAVSVAFVAVLIVFVFVVLCCCWLRSRRRKKKPPTTPSENHDPATMEQLLSGSPATPTSRNSRSDVSDSGHSSQISIPDARFQKSLPVSHISESAVVKDEATMPSFHPEFGNPPSDSGYSNMPTTEFREPLRSNHNGRSLSPGYHNGQSLLPSNRSGQSQLPSSRHEQSLSSMPTRLFDEMHPSLVGNAAHVSRTTTTSSHHSYRPYSQRRGNRSHIDQSSSSENLLENADRDSKLVGGRQTPLEFQADSFDTRSNPDVTKPHVLESSG